MKSKIFRLILSFVCCSGVVGVRLVVGGTWFANIILVLVCLLGATVFAYMHFVGQDLFRVARGEPKPRDYWKVFRSEYLGYYTLLAAGFAIALLLLESWVPNFLGVGQFWFGMIWAAACPVILYLGRSRRHVYETEGE